MVSSNGEIEDTTGGGETVVLDFSIPGRERAARQKFLFADPPTTSNSAVVAKTSVGARRKTLI